MDMEENKIRRIKMRLKNGETLLHWPLAQHIITAGWLYNDGKIGRAHV